MLFYCCSLAASYLNDVILKEGLAAILEAITGGAYDEADAECRLVLESSITRATFYAMELSNLNLLFAI